jgi:hypothetical protein
VEKRGENTRCTCERRVDETRNSGDLGKVQGISLGIRKYRLTRGFPSARVSSRTGQRTPTGAGKPSRSSPIFGSGSAETGRADEAQRVRNGARSHKLRPDRTTGNRRGEGPRFRADAVRTPQLFVRSWFGRRYCDGTVYRVSVNGVDGANGAGQPADRGSNSGNGVRVSGRPGRGSPATGSASAGDRVGAAP